MTELKPVIKSTFDNMYTVARFNMKKTFKSDKKQGKQYDMARALVFLRDVAKNPDNYFAPEKTNVAWDARVEDYIKTSQLSAEQIKMYGIKYVRVMTKRSIVVEQPYTIVFRNISPLFQDRNLWDFCESVQDFYYQNFSKYVWVNEIRITDFAEKMSEAAKIAKTRNIVKRGFIKFLSSEY